MPELPEVEITKQKLQVLLGKTITNFWTDLEKNLKINSYPKTKQDIISRKIIKIDRLGKTILIYLSPKKDEKILAFHQRMSGRLIIKKSDELKSPSSHIHFKIKFNDNSWLYFEDQRKFGIVWYGAKKEIFNDNYFKNLGKDALNINFDEFKKIVQRRKRAIKPLLLNQKFIAGIGNILADEILWLSKIHPQTKIQNLNPQKIKKLWESTIKIIKKSIKFGGASLRNWNHPDQTKGEFQNKTYVYGRANQNCQRCQIKIMKIKSAGRGTYLCPKCQKLNL